MNTSKIKKHLLYTPYLVVGLLGTKLGEAARLAPGIGFSQKTIYLAAIRQFLI